MGVEESPYVLLQCGGCLVHFGKGAFRWAGFDVGCEEECEHLIGVCEVVKIDRVPCQSFLGPKTI